MMMIALGVYFILFVVAGNILYVQYKQIVSLNEKISDLTKNVDEVQKSHPVLINADLLFSKQLKDINSQLVSMDNQIQNLENKRVNDGGYQHALRILEMGGNKDEIIDSCHLSNAEADLLLNLQAYRNAMKASL
jgi:hypothetical protein